MRKYPAASLLTLVLAAIAGAGTSTAASSELSEHTGHLCRFCAPAPATPPSPAESSKYRKYTPDKQIEVQHVIVDITPDFQKRTIQGTVTLRFKALHTPLSELRLNAVDLHILSAENPGGAVPYQVTQDEVVCTFPMPVPAGQESTITLRYQAEPTKGLYFRTREMGYTQTQLWTQGEPTESRHWFPCLDHPVAKFTSEVVCHLPKGMVALSNGRQIATSVDSNGLEVFRWLQDKPHSNYLVTLVAGELAKVEDKLRDIPLEFWTTPEELPQAQNSFRTTRNVMEFLERETGVPYPWAKYAQVTIQDYHWGGMENTSITTLTDRTLHTADTENLFLSESLVAHELAHQWFGDLVTCKDWSHLWLNEGFATYYDWLWQGRYGGPNETLYALHNAAKGILSNSNETRGIVWRKFNEPGEMFNYLAYPKGAWVLHMLRSQLGPDLYRKCIQTYLERYAYKSATSDDLRNVIEELSGRSFERFFDQWVHGIGAPVLDVEYVWDEKAKQAKVSIKQTQKITEDAYLFQFPLQLRFQSKDGTVLQTVPVREKQEDFYFALKTAPESVRINSDLGLLAKINFKPARPMLFAQLADNADIVGQLLALDQLADKPDTEAIVQIQAALKTASHYGVRIRAAEVLQQARSDGSFAVLQEALTAPDARVRNAVVRALGGFYRDEARLLLEKTVVQEKNPGIRATALRGLAPYQTPEVRALLLKQLDTPAYKERVAEGALAAIKMQADPALSLPLTQWLAKRVKGLPSAVLANGLETLGTLEQGERNKNTARETLLSYLNHPKEKVRLAAITGLGNLEDPRAIAVLETLVQTTIYRPEKGVAEKALEKIRTSQKPAEELKELRTEISNLQDAGRDLKRELEGLRKRLEAKP